MISASVYVDGILGKFVVSKEQLWQDSWQFTSIHFGFNKHSPSMEYISHSVSLSWRFLQAAREVTKERSKHGKRKGSSRDMSKYHMYHYLCCWLNHAVQPTTYDINVIKQT